MNALAQDLVRALDPVALGEAIGIAADPWQEDVWRSNHPSIMLNCTRQGGKSSAASVLAMHAALYEPGSMVLLLSRTQRQAGELFKKVMTVYRAVGRPVPADSENTSTLELENGSRVISLPGDPDTVRSYSAVRLLIVDEASRVSDELMGAVRPMLAVSGGRLITLSTPHGKRGWWSEAWHDGGDDYKRVKITAYDCPRITDEFLKKERRALGEWRFKQEYMCEFVESAEQVFSEEQIRRAFDSDFDSDFKGL